MEGDSRNPRVSLLKKYDIPIEHLSFEYIETCSNKKELERIIRILRSGEEGSYPDLLRVTEEQLRLVAPESRVLRVETPILTKAYLKNEEWSAVEKELLSWEEEMNIVDKSLDFEKGRFEVVGNKNLPEVRKVVQPPLKNKPEKKSKAITDNNNRRIKSGDYDGWDKFDVDKELLKMDVEEERKQEENEKKKREAKRLEKEKKVEIVEVDKENYSSTEQQVLADQAKDRGNECFKSGDLESALKYYEISINLHSTANAYNNRAMTYLKLKQYENALKDCNRALHLEKTNVKALYRRATAYQNMPDKKEKDEYDRLALEDLQQIIVLEPNNKAAQTDLQKLKKKLNIEDGGRKFRMPISEDFSGSSSKQTEAKYTSNGADNVYIDRLPLTYYGPSTSTFQCLRYSMVHRALSGPSFDEILCKCNSSGTRQNPLCQRCGEAMCKPKPRKAVKANESKISSKKENETKNELIEQKRNKIIGAGNKSTSLSKDALPFKNKAENYIANINLVKSSPVLDKKHENHLKEETKSVGIENRKTSDRNNNPSDVIELGKTNSIVNNVSNKPVNLTENSLICSNGDSDNSEKKDKNSERPSIKVIEPQVEKSLSGESNSLNSEILKTVEPVCNKNSEAKNTENSSSQGDVSRSSKKSKNKKKSKEHKESKTIRKHLESVNVVHAAEYLNPTSVEPKNKNETTYDQQRQSSFSTNVQYKAFVPSRMCNGTENQRVDSSTPSPLSVPKKTFPANDVKANNDLSYEGNKENILENNNSSSSVENPKREDEGSEVNREVVKSAFEFLKSWEELKKFDESYTKRAEIIRKMIPSDLSKVIGIKLDSDMLSCLLECLLRHFVESDPKKVVELLKQLPQVPRFGLVSMFLAEADKKKISRLIEATEGKGFKLDEEVKKSLQILS